MQHLITFTVAIMLSTSALAGQGQKQQQDGKGLHPDWLISHDG